MTTPESPSSLLERAAARVDQLSREATRGPWAAEPNGSIVYRSSAIEATLYVVASEHSAFDVMISAEDEAWITSMSPSVASPLVEWLRAAAFEFEEAAGPAEAAGEPVESYVGSASRAALTFARQVLGES